ncbi:segregation/condensation protein A [Aerococcaceae bacterium WGS1372]
MLAAIDRQSKKDFITLDHFIEYGTRSEIVTTFLAMLELVRKQHLIFIQNTKDDPIQIRKFEESNK